MPQMWAELAASPLIFFSRFPCRKRKIHMYKEAVQAAQQAELEAKQALIPVQEYSPGSPQPREPALQEERAGEVLVQWKDGTVTTLYKESSEDAM